MKRSEAERFEGAYGRIWASLRRFDDPDLSEHERQVLHHIPARPPGIPLTWLASHLAMPKSTTSVLVKDLARRGFVRRGRDAGDERRLALVLTEKGRRRVAEDTLFDRPRLEEILRSFSRARRVELIADLERLAEAAQTQARGLGG